MKEVIAKVLKTDAKKAFDIAAYNQFNATPLTVAPTAGTATDVVTLTTNGTVTITNNVALGNGHVKAIVDLMKERNIPPYMADDYVSIAHPSTLRNFKNDLEQVRKYVDMGFQLVLNGEVGRHETTRFVEQTNISKENWSNGKSNQAFFFGADTVAEGVVIPEEMRGKIPTDFGRSRGIAWYYMGGFGIVHALNAANNSRNARIVKWASAA